MWTVMTGINEGRPVLRRSLEVLLGVNAGDFNPAAC
jgi:hypothetical protein